MQKVVFHFNTRWYHKNAKVKSTRLLPKMRFCSFSRPNGKQMNFFSIFARKHFIFIYVYTFLLLREGLVPYSGYTN